MHVYVLFDGLADTPIVMWGNTAHIQQWEHARRNCLRLCSHIVTELISEDMVQCVPPTKSISNYLCSLEHFERFARRFSNSKLFFATLSSKVSPLWNTINVGFLLIVQHNIIIMRVLRRSLKSQANYMMSHTGHGATSHSQNTAPL